MITTRPISEYSRQELYDLIWSTPVSKLAAHFGISNVAIAKHCKKRNLPRPSRGYWAKVAAGHKPRKEPLPPTTEEVFKQAAQRRLPKNLRLPGDTEPLLPLASALMKAITEAKLDCHKRAHLLETTLPQVTVSKILAERTARAFHAILTSVEPMGIPFRKSRRSSDAGYFERRYDRLTLAIAEDLIGPDGSKYSAACYGSYRENGKPSGHLTFSLNSDQYGSQKIKQWSESAKLPLEKVLAHVVAAIRQHFVEAQERSEQEAAKQAKEHAEWLQHYHEWEKKEAIRLQQERVRKHAGALAAAVRARKQALMKAARNWRRSNNLLTFIAACEARWNTHSATPTAEQTGWLTWARQIASAMSPFQVGYPDPANDGAFDPTSIPFGGPYPEPRDFSSNSTQPLTPPSPTQPQQQPVPTAETSPHPATENVSRFL